MAEHKPRKLCIAVGASPEAQAALRWAAKRLVQPDDQVYLLNVVSSSTKAEAEGGSGGEYVVRHDLVKSTADPRDVKAALQLLESCKAELLREAHIPATAVHPKAEVTCVESSHDVGRKLVDAAAECGCDAMIIGSRGLGLSRRAMLGLFGLGSVSNFVVQHSPINVMVHKQTITAGAASPQE